MGGVGEALPEVILVVVERAECTARRKSSEKQIGGDPIRCNSTASQRGQKRVRIAHVFMCGEEDEG